ncbi:MAG: hypothetical protein JWN93_3530, partial [Hyphomicrobiales bacterium]|nr:hypothetical protein [Hyphomicrobiales bacterium]
MLFLLRSAFWLGLVFAIAPGAADDPRRDSAAKAASAAVLAAGDMATSLPGQAEAACRKAPRDCLELAQKLAAKAQPAAAPTPPVREPRRAERPQEA